MDPPPHKHVKVINSCFIRLMYNLASLYKQWEGGIVVGGVVGGGGGGLLFMEIILPYHRRLKSGCFLQVVVIV